jgi:NitT/TauT family transport system substrate-binding protein
MTSVRDLRGATVGVTGLGSGLEYYVRYLAVRNGLPPNDISPISIGAHAARVAALEQGRIDAAILGEPGLSLLRQRHPGLVVLADMTTKEGMQAFFGADSYPATAFFATSRWLKANPNLAHSLARAIKRTLAWLQSHTAEDIAGQIPAHLKGEDAVLYTEAVRKLLPWYSRDGMMPRDGVELLHQVVATSVEKVRSAKVDVSRLYTNEFVQ